MSRDGVLDAIAFVLVLIPVIDWLSVAVLTRAAGAARRRFGRVPGYLSERRRVATIIALSATLGAVLGVSRLLHGWLPADVGLGILVMILALPSLANALWLWQVLRGDFGGETR